MAVRMGAREARQKFSEMVGRVRYGGETVILESSGKAVAAVIPIDRYEKMQSAEREARFEAIERIRARIPQYPEEEVRADIEEAIREVRRERAEGGS